MATDSDHDWPPRSTPRRPRIVTGPQRPFERMQPPAAMAADRRRQGRPDVVTNLDHHGRRLPAWG
ncbi:MAG TPA: hypothetical protein VIE43_15650 [Thermoanaerobaculia bacterium]|nr:hypothetical protein [Thermoanaerobaculia bacterium]